MAWHHDCAASGAHPLLGSNAADKNKQTQQIKWVDVSVGEGLSQRDSSIFIYLLKGFSQQQKSQGCPLFQLSITMYCYNGETSKDVTSSKATATNRFTLKHDTELLFQWGKEVLNLGLELNWGWRCIMHKSSQYWQASTYKWANGQPNCILILNALLSLLQFI